MNAKEGFEAMAKDHANLFRQNNSLSNEWYPKKNGCNVRTETTVLTQK
jgi:hypothetical protein